MGLFDTNHYPQDAHYVPVEDIKRLASHYRVLSLTDQEAKKVDEFLIVKQHYHGGKISLHQIYEVLQELFHARQISQVDRDELIKQFVAYFKSHFK